MGVGSAIVGGVAKGAGNVLMGAGKVSFGAGYSALVGAGFVGKVGGKVALSGLKAVGQGTMNFFGGAGTAVAETLRDPNAREAVVKTWASKAKTLGEKFVTGDRGNMRISAFGLGALTLAGWVDNGRDIYDQNTARNMGAIDNRPVTNTPSMTIPQYDFSPQKRMGALDGGASGSLVFALRNNR